MSINEKREASKVEEAMVLKDNETDSTEVAPPKKKNRKKKRNDSDLCSLDEENDQDTSISWELSAKIKENDSVLKRVDNNTEVEGNEYDDSASQSVKKKKKKKKSTSDPSDEMEESRVLEEKENELSTALVSAKKKKKRKSEVQTINFVEDVNSTVQVCTSSEKNHKMDVNNTRLSGVSFEISPEVIENADTTPHKAKKKKSTSDPTDGKERDSEVGEDNTHVENEIKSTEVLPPKKIKKKKKKKSESLNSEEDKDTVQQILISNEAMRKADESNAVLKLENDISNEIVGNEDSTVQTVEEKGGTSESVDRTKKDSEVGEDNTHVENEMHSTEVPPPKKSKKKKKKKSEALNFEKDKETVEQILISSEAMGKVDESDVAHEIRYGIDNEIVRNDNSIVQTVEENRGTPESTEGKRKLSCLEDKNFLSPVECEAADADLPPKKKKKRKNKSNSTKKNLDSQQTIDCVSTEIDGNGTELNVEGRTSSEKVPEHVGGSSQETKKKKKKRKKKKKQDQSTSVHVVTSGGDVTSSIAEGSPFSSLQCSISEKTLKAVTDMGFTKMTTIQEKAITPLLEGRDVRGTAKTGSGKTLAFIIPVVERLSRLNFTHAEGTGALIISPTRELSMQTYNVLNKVIKGHSLTSGILIGGADQTKEAEHLNKGANVIVATPGRLLSHLKNTSDFLIENLVCLVLDEADRMLDLGFEKDMNAILELLPKKKQTMFFSATRGKEVNLLARLSLNSEPIEVEADSQSTTATVDGLEQAYILCQLEKKFLILHNFLEKNKKKKIMVFFSTCNAVKFYCRLLNTLGLNVMDINGKNLQEERTKIFYNFLKLESGILLCTDVAARGWDIPLVDWIVQFDPPRDPTKYIHRVGRTARAGEKGKALLFICHEEKGLIKILENHKLHLKMENFTWDKSKDLGLRVEKIVRNNKDLKVLALKGLVSHIGGYFKYNNKKFMDISKVNLSKLAKCFGYENLPQLPKKMQSQLDALGTQKSQKVKSNDVSSKPQHTKGKAVNSLNKPHYQKGRSSFSTGKPQLKTGKFSKPQKIRKPNGGGGKSQQKKTECKKGPQLLNRP